MATEDDAEDVPVDEGPDPAGAIAPPRNPEDGTPMAPKPNPHNEPHMTDEAADALEIPVETGEDVPQP